MPQALTPGAARAGSPSQRIITSTNRVAPKLLPPREKVLVAADSASGKTYGWMRMIRKIYLASRAAGTQCPKVYVIDTDDAMPKFIGPGMEFEALSFENGGPVYPFPAFSWQDYYASWQYISEKAEMGDYLIVDVINRSYDQAQWRLAEYQGKNLDDEVASRALNNQGFGGFEGKDWNVVTRMFNSVFDPALHHSKLNVFFMAHITDMIDVEGREKREAMTLFDEIGLKPRGPRAVYELCDTVIVMWAKRAVDRNARGQRVGKASTVRKLALLKDRGVPANDVRVYDRDMWDTVLSIREEYKQRRLADPEFSLNITDPEELAKLEDDDPEPEAATPTDIEPQPEYDGDIPDA